MWSQELVSLNYPPLHQFIVVVTIDIMKDSQSSFSPCIPLLVRLPQHPSAAARQQGVDWRRVEHLPSQRRAVEQSKIWDHEPAKPILSAFAIGPDRVPSKDVRQCKSRQLVRVIKYKHPVRD